MFFLNRSDQSCHRGHRFKLIQTALRLLIQMYANLYVTQSTKQLYLKKYKTRQALTSRLEIRELITLSPGLRSEISPVVFILITKVSIQVPQQIESAISGCNMP